MFDAALRGALSELRPERRAVALQEAQRVLLDEVPAMLPLAAGTFVVWAVVFLATRYVSVASTAAALAMLAGVLVVDTTGGCRLDLASPWTARWPLTAFTILLVGAVLFRHRENYRRLLAGTENKFGRKKRAADGES